MAGDLDYGVLGPLQATRAGGPVYLGSARKQRMVLAALIAAERIVSVDWLIDAVWAGRPPESARPNVRAYVHRLRSVLGGDQLCGGPGGYALTSGRVDAWRFRELVAEGRMALLADDVELALDRLGAALGLWRGPAFVEFTDCEPIAEQASRLERLRIDAFVWWAEAALVLGRHEDVARELVGLAKANPYREDLTGHLIQALYGMGRKAEALELFRTARAQFRDGLGVEPGPALQRLHQAMRRGDASVAVPSRDARATVTTDLPAPRKLPRRADAFTGRGDALRWLDALLCDPAGTPRSSSIVVAVVGAAGVGKTALAVHWAHGVADRFPDGQLYVDLAGCAAGEPMRPIDALARMLRALGMVPERIPVDVAEAAACYRSLCAGRRLLVVLDNAASAEQVRPLVPGGPGCVVVVTSRDRLTGLTARDGVPRLTLGVLTAAESASLLVRMLGAERVRAEPEASRELAALCCHLPLALRIVLASLADQPDRRIADHVAKLRANPVEELAVGEEEESRSMRHAFDLSYRNRAGSTQRLFRRLGLVGCHDFTAETAAALAGISERDAGRELDRLAANHLLEQRPHGRYGLHDLLRHYARDVARAEDSAAERSAAVSRLCGYYLAAISGAAQLLDTDIIQSGTPVTAALPPAVNDKASALRWLDAERHNLVAVVRHTARYGPADMAWRLTEALRGFC